MTRKIIGTVLQAAVEEVLSIFGLYGGRKRSWIPASSLRLQSLRRCSSELNAYTDWLNIEEAKATIYAKIPLAFPMTTMISITKPSQKILNEVTLRIVKVAKPLRVLLFGSAARGRMTKDSDLDVLVIVHGPTHRRHMAQKIYRNLHGIDIAVDIIVATEEDLQKYGRRAGMILKPALREGRVLYEV